MKRQKQLQRPVSRAVVLRRQVPAIPDLLRRIQIRTMANTAVDIRAVLKGLTAEYKKNATTQTQIVDLFLVFILATGIMQVNDPRPQDARNDPHNISFPSPSETHIIPL